jgi:hypothetical protein
MIFYSVIPMEIVFQQEQQFYKQKEVHYHGVQMLGGYNEKGQYVIERIISTKPSDYLNAKCQPGNILEIHGKNVK